MSYDFNACLHTLQNNGKNSRNNKKEKVRDNYFVFWLRKLYLFFLLLFVLLNFLCKVEWWKMATENISSIDIKSRGLELEI